MRTHGDDVLDMQAVRQQAARLAKMARDEDLGSRGDITSALIADMEPASFHLLGKACGVFAGREVAADVLSVFESRIRLHWMEPGQDGNRVVEPPTHLATLTGPLRAILSAERTLLNFLQRLSGVATATRRFVDAVAGTRAVVLDTRKTIPGWRCLDKYAVRCGGGRNHRLGLHDAVLLKDNHLVGIPVDRLAQEVDGMLLRLRELCPPPAFIEVEADRLEQVEVLLHVRGIDVILLDNLTPNELRRAVDLRNRHDLADTVQFEVSGGVTLETVRAVAETGVERISVGAITHSAAALDLSLERVG